MAEAGAKIRAKAEAKRGKNRGLRMRQGLRMRTISRKSRRIQGRQWGQGRRLRLRLWR